MFVVKIDNPAGSGSVTLAIDNQFANGLPGCRWPARWARVDPTRRSEEKSAPGVIGKVGGRIVRILGGSPCK
jgi:hypothetical protein